MPVIHMPITVSINSAELLTSEELLELYFLALEREEQAKQKSIARAVRRTRLVEKTSQLFGCEVAARVMHLA